MFARRTNQAWSLAAVTWCVACDESRLSLIGAFLQRDRQLIHPERAAGWREP
jgi:hypothetical protein